MKAPIYVTQPYLPPLEEFEPYLREIWRSKILANAGPFHPALTAQDQQRVIDIIRRP